MRSFSSNFSSEIAAETAFLATLVELQLSSTYRYNNTDIDIAYGGNIYNSSAFSVPSLKGSSQLSVDSINIEFGNVNLTMSAILLSEDVRSKTAITYEACLNNNYRILAIESMFNGKISNWSFDEKKAKVIIVNELAFWNKKTLRLQSPSCPWDFVTDGSGECGYSNGSTWCDQSHDRCKILSNTNSFGGFRFLPSISEKQVWWGKSPK